MTSGWAMRTSRSPSTSCLFRNASQAKPVSCSIPLLRRREDRPRVPGLGTSFATTARSFNRSRQDVCFSSSSPCNHNHHQSPPQDDRAIQLGRTVRALHDRLPTLLLSPLPSEILAPQISLHLFPSTHPHLPAVSGRIAYVAALWTAPVAWGRVPLVGNVRLAILSERMVRDGFESTTAGRLGSARAGGEEKLVVKWKTCGKMSRRNDAASENSGALYRGAGIGIRDPLEILTTIATRNGKKQGRKSEEEFCGIFIFEFDGQGKIAKHVIEHTEEGGHWDKTARVVSVTDWLLGQLNSRTKDRTPELALCEDHHLTARSKRL